MIDWTCEISALEDNGGLSCRLVVAVPAKKKALLID